MKHWLDIIRPKSLTQIVVNYDFFKAVFFTWVPSSESMRKKNNFSPFKFNSIHPSNIMTECVIILFFISLFVHFR